MRDAHEVWHPRCFEGWATRRFCFVPWNGRVKVKGVGSKTFDGVWFVAYSHDHPPPHVHGRYAGVQVLVELVDGKVRLAQRPKAVRPRNGKQSDVNHILNTATKHAVELRELWRVTHG